MLDKSQNTQKSYRTTIQPTHKRFPTNLNGVYVPKGGDGIETHTPSIQAQPPIGKHSTTPEIKYNMETPTGSTKSHTRHNANFRGNRYSNPLSPLIESDDDDDLEPYIPSNPVDIAKLYQARLKLERQREKFNQLASNAKK